MKPDKYFPTLKEISMMFFEVRRDVLYLHALDTTYHATNSSAIELEREHLAKLMEQLYERTNALHTTLMKCDMSMAEIINLSPPPTPGIKRWKCTPTGLKEATVEELAQDEGITPEEYLRRETAEFGEIDELEPEP